MRRALAAVAALPLLAGFPRLAHAATTPGAAALTWAVSRATGCWYTWGGTGPCSRGYDCSGLVYAAFRAEGVALPRTTYAMLSSSRLTRTYTPQRGDLAFYGPGHVEFVTIWPHATYGALRTGTRTGWHTWNTYWHPTAYYRVR